MWTDEITCLRERFDLVPEYSEQASIQAFWTAVIGGKAACKP